MNSPLPTTLAQTYCMALQRDLVRFHCLDFEGARSISTDHLFSVSGGCMFGVLVCKDQYNNEVVLKAFSGQYQRRWEIPGWVPPVCNSREYENIRDSGYESFSQCNYEDQKKACAIETQRNIHNLYRFCCINKREISLFEIFEGKNPPSGAGDCCAPKLLHYAFSHDLHPISMAEFFFGRSISSHKRVHEQFYPPCEEKCRPILKHLLGIDILYCDEELVVVDKPSGLLSVPGNISLDSVETRVRHLFAECIEQPAVHRLDMDTSGIMILARTKESHRNLSKQFIHKCVTKYYEALVEGPILQEGGTITLPFRLDPENRPHQIYDPVEGKWGTTEWRRLLVFKIAPDRIVSALLFSPKTGRTHQLRLHSSHALGLGVPIVGDRLYGKGSHEKRLMLHACYLSCVHPKTEKKIEFFSQTRFPSVGYVGEFSTSFLDIVKTS